MINIKIKIANSKLKKKPIRLNIKYFKNGE